MSDDTNYEPIPATAYQLIDRLSEIYQQSELVQILMNPLLSNEQRLYLATRYAAKMEFVGELMAMKAEEIENATVATTILNQKG